MEEAKSVGVGELRERVGGAVVLRVFAAYEQPRVARKKIQIEVNGYGRPPRSGVFLPGRGPRGNTTTAS